MEIHDADIENKKHFNKFIQKITEKTIDWKNYKNKKQEKPSFGRKLLRKVLRIN